MAAAAAAAAAAASGSAATATATAAAATTAAKVIFRTVCVYSLYANFMNYICFLKN